MPDASPLIAVSTGFTDYADYLGVVYSRPLARLGRDRDALVHAPAVQVAAEVGLGAHGQRVADDQQ